MIKVTGIIGNQEQQYSLVHLIQDVNKQPADQPLHILINSPGGDGELAFDMHDYLRGLNRHITTESHGQCASAASILFLSGDTRIAGSPIMIHNPWSTVEGDADTLTSAAKWIGEFEKRCEKFYSQKTGVDPNTISNLMKRETYITPTQSVSLNFATQAKQIAMAHINTNQNQNTNQNTNPMTNKNSANKNPLNAFLTALANTFARNNTINNMLDLATATGETIQVDREDGTPQVGDPATPDGEHLMPDGTTIIIEEGLITEILEAEQTTEDQEVEQLRAQIRKLKQENAQLKNRATRTITTKELEQLNAIKIAGGTTWLSKQCSHYKPATRTQTAHGVNANSRTQQRLAELKAKRQA